MKTIESISELKEVLKGLMATNQPYTFDYYDGCQCHYVQDTIYIEIDEPAPGSQLCYSGTLIIFTDQNQLHRFLINNANNFDPFKGADDQYYDYSPSQLEAILTGLRFASLEILTQVNNKIVPKLQSFILDKDQDEDQIDSYKKYLENFTKGDYLTGTELGIILEDINKL